MAHEKIDDFLFALDDECLSDCTIRINLAADGPRGADTLRGASPAQGDIRTGNTTNHGEEGDDAGPPSGRTLKPARKGVEAPAISGSVATLKEFCAHRVILSQKSDFFICLFLASFREKDSGVVELEVGSREEGEAVMGLVEYLYTGRMPDLGASFSGVLQLMRVADRFQVEELMHACAEAMAKKELSEEEVTRIVGLPASILDSAPLAHIKAAARAKILGRFKWKPQGKAVLELDVGAFQFLLQAGDLAVWSEDNVVEAALQWVRHKAGAASLEEQQNVWTRTVSPYVRWASTSPELIHRLMSAPLFGSPVLKDMLQKAMYLLLFRGASSLSGDAATAESGVVAGTSGLAPPPPHPPCVLRVCFGAWLWPPC